MRFLRIILILIFVLLVCVLYIQNQEIVNHVFKFQIDLEVVKYGPIGVYNIGIITAAFIVGVLFAVIFGAFSSISKSSKLRQKDKTIKDLENEIIHLENKTRGTQAKSSSATSDDTKQSAFTPPGS